MGLLFLLRNRIASLFNKSTKKSTRSNKSNKSSRKTTHQREPIPPEVREQVWISYHGKKMTGQCYCCGIKIHKYHGGWHCSHVKADAKGGPTNVQNLRTCCPSCNLSMGDQNLYVYIRDKDLRGPGRKNASKYLKKHVSQIHDRRTNNWGHVRT